MDYPYLKNQSWSSTTRDELKATKGVASNHRIPNVNASG